MEKRRWFIDDEEGIRWAIRGAGWSPDPGGSTSWPRHVEFISAGARIFAENSLRVDPGEMSFDELLHLLARAKEGAGWKSGPQLELVKGSETSQRRIDLQNRVRRFEAI